MGLDVEKLKEARDTLVAASVPEQPRHIIWHGYFFKFEDDEMLLELEDGSYTDEFVIPQEWFNEIGC